MNVKGVRNIKSCGGIVRFFKQVTPHKRWNEKTNPAKFYCLIHSIGFIVSGTNRKKKKPE